MSWNKEELDKIQKRLDNQLAKQKLDIDYREIDYKITTLGDLVFFIWISSKRKNTCWIFKRVEPRKQTTGWSRTREDCYKIAKNYFPDITFEHISKVSDLLYKKGMTSALGGEIGLLHRSYCCTVRRYVHSPRFGIDMSLNAKVRDQVNKMLDDNNLNIKYEIKSE